MKVTHLWRTTVGSHIWKMNHPGSDLDYFDCFAVSTRDILDGSIQPGTAHFKSSELEDVQNHEVGKWVQELLKSNMNYIIGVHSPLVVDDQFGLLEALRDIARRNMAKNLAPSLNGMVTHNVNLYERRFTEESEWERLKRLKCCARHLKFGIAWMDGRIEFEPVEDPSLQDVRALQKEFTEAVAASKLPEKPLEQAYRNLLFDIRIRELQGVYEP